MAKKSFVEQHWVWLVLVAFIVIVSYKPSTQSVICTQNPMTRQSVVTEMVGRWDFLDLNIFTLDSGETHPWFPELYTIAYTRIGFEATENRFYCDPMQDRCFTLLIGELLVDEPGPDRECMKFVKGLNYDTHKIIGGIDTYWMMEGDNELVYWCAIDSNDNDLIFLSYATPALVSETRHDLLIDKFTTEFYTCEQEPTNGGFSCTGLGG